MLDPSFESRLAPALLPWLYLLLTCGIVVGAVGMIVGLARVESTVDGVADDMPRIGFSRGQRRPSA